MSLQHRTGQSIMPHAARNQDKQTSITLLKALISHYYISITDVSQTSLNIHWLKVVLNVAQNVSFFCKAKLLLKNPKAPLHVMMIFSLANLLIKAEQQ